MQNLVKAPKTPTPPPEGGAQVPQKCHIRLIEQAYYPHVAADEGLALKWVHLIYLLPRENECFKI